jgi:hypothetical protein
MKSEVISELNELRSEVWALKTQMAAMRPDVALLQDKFTQLATDFGGLAGEVSTLRSASAGVPAPSGEVSALKKEIAGLKAQIVQPVPKPPPSPTPIPPPPHTPTPSAPPVPNPPPFQSAPPLDSRIISDFPEIFAEFREKHFNILWRGSRDGFKAREFHGRCDGHANTLTVILDTKGNIFGGFTPVKWEFRTISNGSKAICVEGGREATGSQLACRTRSTLWEWF